MHVSGGPISPFRVSWSHVRGFWAPMTWIDITTKVAASDGLSPISIDDVELVVVRVEDDWWAFEDRCSHAGCAFSQDGEMDDTTVICYCHGSEFDITTGQPTRPPAEEPIRTFPIRMRDGVLEIDV